MFRGSNQNRKTVLTKLDKRSHTNFSIQIFDKSRNILKNVGDRTLKTRIRVHNKPNLSKIFAITLTLGYQNRKHNRNISQTDYRNPEQNLSVQTKIEKSSLHVASFFSIFIRPSKLVWMTTPTLLTRRRWALIVMRDKTKWFLVRSTEAPPAEPPYTSTAATGEAALGVQHELARPVQPYVYIPGPLGERHFSTPLGLRGRKNLRPVAILRQESSGLTRFCTLVPTIPSPLGFTMSQKLLTVTVLFVVSLGVLCLNLTLPHNCIYELLDPRIKVQRSYGL